MKRTGALAPNGPEPPWYPSRSGTRSAASASVTRPASSPRPNAEPPRSALIEAISAIMEQQESSMAGVVIKAQAMTATTDLPVWAGICDGALAWGPALAASILRLAGGGDIVSLPAFYEF